MAVGKEIDMEGEGECLVQPEVSRKRALLERRQVWKFHHCYQPVNLTERSFLCGSPDLQTSLDIQQGAGAEPLLGMLASVARVLASVAQGLASVA